MSNQSPGLWPDAEFAAEESPQAPATSGTEEAIPPVDKAPEPTMASDPVPSVKEGAASSKPPKKAKAAVAKTAPSEPEPAAGTEKISKSRRIREYLEAHPDARNRDIAAALEQYGVKAADVANVKALQKQRSEDSSDSASSPNSSSTSSSAADLQAAPKGKRGRKKAGRKPGRSAAAASSEASTKRTAAASKQTGTTEIGLSEVDAAIRFIEQAGGIDRARQIIDLVDRIRKMNIG